MTAWILLLALAALFALAVRHGRPTEPPVPSGFDGERQLAELRALPHTRAATSAGDSSAGSSNNRRAARGSAREW